MQLAEIEAFSRQLEERAIVQHTAEARQVAEAVRVVAERLAEAEIMRVQRAELDILLHQVQEIHNAAAEHHVVSTCNLGTSTDGLLLEQMGYEFVGAVIPILNPFIVDGNNLKHIIYCA